MRSFYCFLLSAVLLNVATVTVSSAATINVIDENTIQLDGIVEIGDFEKIKTYLMKGAYFVENVRLNQFRLHLSSPGGNLNEGLKIAKLVEEMNVESFIENGHYCESVCAVIFLASRTRSIHQHGYLGLHSPGLNIPSGADISKDSFSGTEVVSLFDNQVRWFSELLSLENFPKSAALIWASTPTTEMYYVEKMQEISQMNINVKFSKTPLVYFDTIQSARNICHNNIIDKGYSSEAYVQDILDFKKSSNNHDEQGDNFVVGFWVEVGLDYMSMKCSVDFGNYSVSLSSVFGDSNDDSWTNKFSFSFQDRLDWSQKKQNVEVCETEILCQSKREKQIKDILHKTADVRSEQNQPTSCFVGKDFFLSQVINVESYTNLRSAPDLKAKIIARVPLGTSVRFTDPSISYVTGPCKTICQANTDIPKIQECIEKNQVWMEVAYENKKGFLSRKFLE